MIDTNGFRRMKDHNLVSRQKLKHLRQGFVAMNMMNKCAKFHKDSPSGKKVKAGPPLEAILVIFGRRALIFFCLKALGKK